MANHDEGREHRSLVEKQMLDRNHDLIGAHAERSPPSRPHIESVVACVMEFLVQEQAILRVACATQANINALLGRARPTRAFGSADVDVHNLLQGSESRRLPYLLDELEDFLGVGFAVDVCRIELTETHARAGAAS
jgi:hypothetical protein